MKPRVLLLSERRPDANALGGTELVVYDLLCHAPPGASLYGAHRSGGRLVVEAWNGGRRSERAALELGTSRAHALDSAALGPALAAAVLGTDASVLHVHSPGLAPRSIASAVDATGARLIITLHDHALACEIPHLLERGERYCALPDDARRCDACLALTLGRAPGRLSAWRDAMGALVERADVIIAPSASVARLVALVHPRAGEKIRRIDWGATARERVAVTGRSGPLRVAIIGVLADVKGASRLPELLSACRDLDVEWHLFGAREGRPLGPIRRAAPRVVVHGSYRRSELARRLNGAACELALLPSIAPEAFGLVLSELAAAGCPALVSNLGALPERIAELGAGFVFDPWNPAELRAKLAPLVDNRQRLVEAARVLGQVPPWTPVEMAEAHLELWREVMQRGPRRAVGSPERAAARRRLDAERRTSAPVRAAARAVRRSAFYRDLGVRGWLPEAFRARCEQAAKSVLDRLLDRRGSR